MIVQIGYTDDDGTEQEKMAQPLACFTILDRGEPQRACLHCKESHRHGAAVACSRWLDVHGVGIRWVHEACMAGIEGRSTTRGL